MWAGRAGNDRGVSVPNSQLRLKLWENVCVRGDNQP